MPARGHERFTVLVVPHSARPTAALRLSSRAIQILCAGLIVAFFSLTVFAARYAQLVSYMHELRDLRMLTVAQEEQLKLLQGTASELRDRLGDLAQLDRELRQLLSLEPPPTPIEELLAASKSVTIAKGPSTSATGSSATVTTLAVETSLMSKAGYLTDSFAVLREEMEDRVASLEDLRVAAAEQLAYDAARPSIWPANGYITSGYGYRTAPIGGYRQFHPAVDIAAPVGTPVVATGDGRVVFSGWKHDLGNTVMIDHGYDFRTLYAHVARVVVVVGDRVKKGQVIAYVGSTGRSTGPHLHYEVHLRGKETNPRPYLR
jgi:murein DD-endopeptidase MepM/ murein hydrolase activator NlpD